MRRLLKRLFPCFLWFNHEWEYDSSRNNQERTCKRCGEFNSYELVDFGRTKVWMRWKADPAKKMVREWAKHFPDRCLICSYHRYGWCNGFTSEEIPPHDCIELKGSK